MAVSIYSVSPSPGLSPNRNGDVYAFQQKTDTALTTVADANLAVGSIGGTNIYFCNFYRFEVDIPAGSKITGVALRQYTAGTGSFNTFNVRGGFIKRDGKWDAAGGMYNYATDSEVPFAQWDLNNNSDVTVWWGNAPAFSSAAIFGSVFTDFEYSIVENTSLTSGINVTGMVAQLQSYLDDTSNEATRGSGYVSDSIPVCFQLLRPYAGTSVGYIWYRSSDHGSLAPELIVEYIPRRIIIV